MKRIKVFFVGALTVLMLPGCDGRNDVTAPRMPAANVVLFLVPKSSLLMSAGPGLDVPEAATVMVVDQSGKPLINVPVGFVVASGGGAVANALVTTDSLGLARSGKWRLGEIPGVNTLVARIAGGAPVTFSAIGQLSKVIASYDLEKIDGRTLPFSFSFSGTWDIIGGHYVLADDSTYTFGYELKSGDGIWISGSTGSSYSRLNATIIEFYYRGGGLFSTGTINGNVMAVKVEYIDDFVHDEVYVLSHTSGTVSGSRAGTR